MLADKSVALRKVLQWTSKVPLSVRVGATAVLIILAGWYFNVWQVIGIKNSFPYLEISKPFPELHKIEPQSTVPGETVTLYGAKLEAFDPQSSRVVIGSVSAEVQNWNRKAAQITVKVPQKLIPGRYPVSVQIAGRQSVEEVLLHVRLIPQSLARHIESGERVLILVAQFEGDERAGTLQTDIIEQMRYHVSRDQLGKDRLVIAPWPEVVAGVVGQRLREIATSTKARLILFGRTGTGENFYPRIFSDPPTKDILLGTEQQLRPASRAHLQVGIDTYELPATSVKESLRMAQFLLGLGRYQLGDYQGARTILNGLLAEKGLETIDEASLHLASGRVTVLMGSEILERPLRSDQDHRQGDDLLKEGINHLRQAASKLSEIEGRRLHAAQAFLSLGLAAGGLPFGSRKEKHQQAIDYYEKALQHLDCGHDFTECMTAYANQANSYEWLASTQWDRGVNDDLLEKAIALTEKALQIHAVRVRENKTLPEGGNLDRDRAGFVHAWLRNQLGIAKGHLYRGDRDRNLQGAVALSEEALPVFLAGAQDMPGRIALTYSHIGRSLMQQEGDRAQLGRQAQEAFEKGLGYVGPEKFREFYKLLMDNKQMLERLMTQGNKMLEGETASRYEAKFDRLFRAGEYREAENLALEYLNWAWREFKRPGRYTATAHALLARVTQQAGGAALASWHAVSARSILSSYERWDDGQLQLAEDLDKKLIELAKVNGYSSTEAQALLRNAAMGFQFYSRYKQEGDGLLRSNSREAIKAYDAALSFYPHNPLVLVNRAAAKRDIEDYRGHAEDLSDALLIYPDDPVARYNRATLYRSVGRWQQALEDLNVAISAGGKKAEFYALRAEAYEGLEERAKALADYRVALQRAEAEQLKKDIERRITKLEKESLR